MKVVPLIQGVHDHKQTASGVFLPGHTGAVTLVEQNDQYLLVDTGGRGAWQRLESTLCDHKLLPRNIYAVVLTHMHLDHSFNAYQFPQAIILAWSHEWRASGTMRLPDIEQVSPLPGLSLIKTPGHALEHLSVVVTMDDGTTTVIAGDAISPDYEPTMPPKAFCHDVAQYHTSAARILSIADYIIPGHGAPFANKKT